MAGRTADGELAPRMGAGSLTRPGVPAAQPQGGWFSRVLRRWGARGGREDLPARLSEPGGPAGVQGLSVGPAPQTSLCI